MVENCGRNNTMVKVSDLPLGM